MNLIKNFFLKKELVFCISIAISIDGKIRNEEIEETVEILFNKFKIKDRQIDKMVSLIKKKSDQYIHDKYALIKAKEKLKHMIIKKKKKYLIECIDLIINADNNLHDSEKEYISELKKENKC